MPKDKRLLIAKAVLGQVARACQDPAKAEAVPVELTFVTPPKALGSNDPLRKEIFQLPNPTLPDTGRVTALIIPSALVTDAAKINTRHRLVDAVVPGEAICINTAEGSKKALQVANAFERYIVDERVVSSLPTEIRSAVASGKQLVVMPVTEPGRDLVHQLTICARSSAITMDHAGKLRIRVGHGNMTAGLVSENCKAFIDKLRSVAPQLYKLVLEFKLETSRTEPIRYMEAHIARN